jgi:hypothetical protein
MTKPKTRKPAVVSNSDAPLDIIHREGVSDDRLLAEVVHNTHVQHALNIGVMGSEVFGSTGKPSINDSVAIVTEASGKVRKGNLGDLKDMLVAQSQSLDAMFSFMTARALKNIAQYPEAVDRYARIALKAQAQCRATVESLDRMANGREQTVRHVHVDNRGGQAVIAETVNTGGQENGKSVNQSDATGAAGIGPSLLSADTFGNGVPIASREGAKAVPDARRDQSWRA